MRRFVTMLILIPVLFISGCSSQHTQGQQQTPTIKIGYLPITHAAPLYLQQASEQEGYKLELVKFSSWTDLMDALDTGRIDGASVLIQFAMKAKALGIDLKAVALGHRDGNVIITAPTIEKVEDLKGKSFAIPNKYSTHNVLLYQMLKNAGISYDDVNVVELPPAEMPAALSEGRIAGYVVAEPFGAISVTLHTGKVLFKSEEIWPDSIDCGLVLRNDFIKKHHSVTQHFVADYANAGQLANTKDEFAKNVISGYLPVKKPVLDLSLQWISYDHLVITKESYKILRDSLIEMNLLDNPPSYEEFVDSSFMK